MNRKTFSPFALVPFALATLLAARASADVAPGPPESLSCPRGAVGTLPVVRPDAVDERGRPMRPWPYCAATVCLSDADCGGGLRCSEEVIGLCIEDHEVPGGDPVRSVRERGCEPDFTCLNLESTCERARRCVGDEAPEAAPSVPAVVEPPAPPPPPPTPAPAAAEVSSSGCACGVGHRGGATLPLWLFASLAGLARARRWRRAFH